MVTGSANNTLPHGTNCSLVRDILDKNCSHYVKPAYFYSNTIIKIITYHKFEISQHTNPPKRKQLSYGPSRYHRYFSFY